MAHILLWIALVAVISVPTGCLSSSFMPKREPAVRPASYMVPTSNQPVRDAAADELGPEVAATIPAQQRPTPRAPEPAAASLVESMGAAIGPSQTGSARIGLTQLRNQSRSGAGEFSAFCDRFAELLTGSANSAAVFTADPEQPVDYQMQGTAYLISKGGSDVWELYLSLSPARDNWTIWQSSGPVHVLRQPRPGQPQIIPE